MPFLAVLGHTNVDEEVRVRELPAAGKVTSILEARRARGGNACNIAVHAASLGVPTRLWSRVGADFDPAWRTDLAGLGVDLACLDVDPAGRTPVCYIFTDLVGRQCFAVDEGAMAGMGERPPGVDVLQGLEGWLHVAAGDPESYAPLAREAGRRGIGVALDPGQEMRFRYTGKLLAAALEWTDLLFVNEGEAQAACRWLGVARPEGLLAHVASVVVTRGGRGASLYRDGQEPVHAAALPVESPEPTGAGDALRAGWYAGLRAGRPWDEALRWGQAAAAWTVGHAGSQDHPVTPFDLERLLSG